MLQTYYKQQRRLRASGFTATVSHYTIVPIHLHSQLTVRKQLQGEVTHLTGKINRQL